MFDALISMGGLSLLYSTSTPSWGTSLNVLFFYLTWTTLLLSHPPLKVELIGTLVVRVIFFWLPALVFLLFDSGLPKLSKNLKLQGHHAVSAGWEKKLKILGWALVNMLLGIMLQIGLEAFSMHVLRRGTLLRIATTLPLPAELVWDVLRGILLREVRSNPIEKDRCIGLIKT